MDLFDTGAYYSNKVPVRAKSSPLLKASICALSAKYVTRMLPAHNTDLKDGWQADVASMPGGNMINWSFYCTKYYHQAIIHLRAAVKYDPDGSDLLSSASDRECVFAAVAVLSMYELMDTPGTAWRAHLSALPLFSNSRPKTSPTAVSPASSETPVTICRPVFWSLARQDFLCACETDAYSSTAVPLLQS